MVAPAFRQAGKGTLYKSYEKIRMKYPIQLHAAKKPLKKTIK
jgi:hypothetical protein